MQTREAKKMGRGSQSNLELTIDGIVYDVTNFASKHPGGSVIRFLTGHDASDAFHAFHGRSKKAKKYLATLASHSSNHSTDPVLEDFSNLRKELKVEGFFEPSMAHITYRIIEVIGLFVGSAVGFYYGWYWSGIGLVALAQGRCGWLQHEAGHYSLTGNIAVDRVLQVLIYNVGTGMSASWWRNQHNRHHATPQKVGHDVDLETLPLVAFHARIAERVRHPVVRAWLRMQAILFAGPITLIVALSWAFVLHPQYVIRKRKWGELAAFAVRYAICGLVASETGLLSFVKGFLLSYTLASAYIFVLFAVSHTHKDVVEADVNVDWVRHAVNYTTNCSPSWFVNWLMSYLNFQIEHHLFPSMPQFRHPLVAKRVQALCQKHDLVYDVRPLSSCLVATFSNLAAVGALDNKKAL